MDTEMKRVRHISSRLSVRHAVLQITRAFLRLYYKMLNNYTSFLYKFYDEDSAISVSEVTEDNAVHVRRADSLNVSDTCSALAVDSRCDTLQSDMSPNPSMDRH